MKTVNLKNNIIDKNGVISYDSAHLIQRLSILSEIHNEAFPSFHRHDFYEIFVCLQGDETHYVDEHYDPTSTLSIKSYKIQKNSIWIIPPACAHSIGYNKHSKNLNIHITEEKYKKLTETLGICDLQNRLLHLDLKDLLFDFEDYYHNIYNNSTSNQNHAILNSILLSNILAMFKMTKNSDPKWLSPLLSDLNNPVYYDSTINSIVSKSFYSYSHLCKLFKKTMGISIVEYRTKSKMEYSVSLLADISLSILDIFLILGYNNCSFFAKTFQKYYGTTPNKYRIEAAKTKYADTHDIQK